MEKIVLPSLILVHGLKRSGKGTVAEHLVSKYGYMRIKFATPLKNMLRSLLRDAGIPHEEIERYVEGDLKEDPIDALEGASGRYIMQTLGVQWRDLISSRLFANITRRRVESLLANNRRLVIDDLRFKEEMEAMIPFEPVLWAVTRENRGVDEDTHDSERGLHPRLFHHVFENNGSLEDLHDSVDSCFSGVVRKEKMWTLF